MCVFETSKQDKKLAIKDGQLLRHSFRVFRNILLEVPNEILYIYPVYLMEQFVSRSNCELKYVRLMANLNFDESTPHLI